MSQSRRGFLGAAVSLVAASAFAATPQAQQPIGQPQIEPGVPADSTVRIPPRRPSPRAILKQNQEEIKKDVARLTETVAELQKALDDADTKDVLSLDVMHKTDEIEKLAKQIRSLVRG